MKAFALFLILVAFASATSLKNGKASPRIVGGDEAVPHSIPYIAYLKMSNETDQVRTCSGSIVSRHYILTSGRCAQNATYVRVILGAHNISSDIGIVTMDTQNINIHPDYKYQLGVYKNDIALLRMEIEIPFHDNIQPIPLPNRDDLTDLENFDGYMATASGWGITDGFVNTSFSTVLEYFDAKVIKTSECRKLMGLTGFDSSVLCSSNDDVQICEGDVGGPLVANSKLIGISSFWPIFCLTGYPAGYTRVTSFIDWIVENSDIVISY